MEIPQPDIITTVAFSPDGGQLAVGTGGGKVILFDTTDWKLQRHVKLPKQNNYGVRGIDYADDATQAIYWTLDDKLVQFDPKTGESSLPLAGRGEGGAT